MDAAFVLIRLWQLRTWVAGIAIISVLVGLLTAYKVDLSGPSVAKKSLEFGAASTELVVDYPNSSLANVTQDMTPLVARAQLYAAFGESQAIQAAIGTQLGVSPTVIATSSLDSISAPRAALEPNAQERANEIRKGQLSWSVTFRSNPDLPLVTVSSQASDGPNAVKLANAAAKAVIDYVHKTQAAHSTQAGQRVVVRQLGTASGGLVNSGASIIVAFLTSAGVFIAGCIGLLLIARVVQQLRARSASDSLAPLATIEVGVPSNGVSPRVQSADSTKSQHRVVGGRQPWTQDD